MSDDFNRSSSSDEMENEDSTEPGMKESPGTESRNKQAEGSNQGNPTRDEAQHPEGEAAAEEAQSAEAQEQQAESETTPPPSGDEELLADVRRSLIEEEEASKRKPGWRGIFRRKPKTAEPERPALKARPKIEEAKTEKAEEPPVAENASDTVAESGTLASEEVNPPVAEADESSRLDAQIENLFAHLEEEKAAKPIPAEEPQPATVEQLQEEAPAKPKEVEAAETPTAHDVLRAQPEKEKADVDFDAMREVALQDYSDEPLQPETASDVTLQRRTRILLRDLRPFDRFLLIVVAGVIVVVAFFGVSSLIRSRQPAEPVATVVVDVPYPVGVTLPGGWEFRLNRGHVVEGRWDPSGAEWLEGTELCKWVAVPWSVQLEAVVRTLDAEDPIELTMSNADNLTYKVQSIRNVPVDQISALERTSPCLLLILAEEDADTRLVVTAIP